MVTWQQETIQRAWYDYRDPAAEEHRRLTEPSRRTLRRLRITAGRYRLMVVKSDVAAALASGWNRAVLERSQDDSL